MTNIEPSAAIVRYVATHPGATSQQIAAALLEDKSLVLTPPISSVGLIYRVNALCANGFLRGEEGRNHQHRFYAVTPER